MYHKPRGRMKLLDLLHLQDAVHIEDLDPWGSGCLDGGAELGGGAVDRGGGGRVLDPGQVPLVLHVQLQPQLADAVQHLRQRVGPNIWNVLQLFSSLQ